MCSSPPEDPNDYEAVIARLLIDVPEFCSRYLELAEAYSDDPPAHAVYEELASFVDEAISSSDERIQTAKRCLEHVELLAQQTTDDLSRESHEIVVNFVDSLSPTALKTIMGLLGPATTELIAHSRKRLQQ